MALGKRKGRSDAEVCAQLGGLLAEVRNHLEHGAWLHWLDQQVPFTVRSAERYMLLHAWAQEHDVLFHELAPLGTSKLYVLARLEPAILRRLLRRKTHKLPDSAASLTIEQMTFPQMLMVIAALLGTLSSPNAIDQLMSNYRRRVRSLVQATKTLSEHSEELGPETIIDVHRQLIEAAEQLAESFELEV